MRFIFLLLVACEGSTNPPLVGVLECYSGGVVVRRYKQCRAVYVDGDQRLVDCAGVGKINTSISSCFWVNP